MTPDAALPTPRRASRAAHRERLLADIGGTNARFAWQRHAGAPIEAVRILPCAGFETLADAVQAYLGFVDRPAPPLCAIAVATPVLGDWVQMTNHHWRFSIAALRTQFGFAVLRVLHDFTARLGSWFARSDFRARFEGKGRFSAYLYRSRYG